MLIAYLRKRQNYKRGILCQPVEAIAKNNQGLMTRNIAKGGVASSVTAPAHKSLVEMAAVHDCVFTFLDHHPGSPDLVSSIFFLFPNLKKHLAWRHYRSDEEVIAAVEEFFRDHDESFCITGMQGLQRRWRKYVDQKGAYVNK